MQRLCCLFLPSDVSFSSCPLTHCKSLAPCSCLPHAAVGSILLSRSVSAAFLCVEGKGGRERNREIPRRREGEYGCVAVCPGMQSCVRAWRRLGGHVDAFAYVCACACVCVCVCVCVLCVSERVSMCVDARGTGKAYRGCVSSIVHEGCRRVVIGYLLVKRSGRLLNRSKTGLLSLGPVWCLDIVLWCDV
jgi:hypothetical protein